MHRRPGWAYLQRIRIRAATRHGNIAVFLREFKSYEDNYNSPDPEKRFPNFVVMSMPEDHTRGTQKGAFTPQAMVATTITRSVSWWTR